MLDFLGVVQRVLEPLPIRGKGRIAEQLLRRTKNEALTCHPLRGLKVQLRRSQRIERLMWAGVYEREVVTFLKRTIRPSMTVIDVGANIGYLSAIAAQLVGVGGEVHAFEPNPGCYACLVGNLRPFSHAHAHQMAISENEGKQRLHLSWNSSEDGWASVLEGTLLEGPAREHRTLEVTATSIDGFVSRSDIRRVDLIKIDIEGNELHALRGGRQTIDRYHPAIIAELNEALLARDGVKPADVVQFLTDQGYSVHHLDGDNISAT